MTHQHDTTRVPVPDSHWCYDCMCFFLCRYEDLYLMYKKAVASFWAVEEVDLSADMRDWDRLTGMSWYRQSPCEEGSKICCSGLDATASFLS